MKSSDLSNDSTLYSDLELHTFPKSLRFVNFGSPPSPSRPLEPVKLGFEIGIWVGHGLCMTNPQTSVIEVVS